MNCDHVRKVLDAYVDKELDEATNAQLAQHLSSCRLCAGARAEREALRAAVRRSPRHDPPARLRRRIEYALTAADGLAAAGWRLGLRRWQSLALPGLAAPIAFALGLWVATPAGIHDGREGAIARHVASLGSGQTLAQVRSSDRHTVKPWFAGKIDFAPPVRDLEKHGFTLIGGRIDSLGGKTAAAIVYRLRQHDVNLFVSPASARPSEPLVASTLRGFALVTWASDGLSFSAISDVDLKELERFADAVRTPQP